MPNSIGINQIHIENKSRHDECRMKKKNKTSKYSLGIICFILFRNSHVIEGKNELNNKKTE